LGEIVYFAHVRELLAELFEAHELDVRIHAVRNYATSSMRKRTLRLAETIAQRAGSERGPIHLVGHSTGGLDARLLCTPSACLGSHEDVASIARRVRSIVTIASPHRGTPLATFFTTRFGAQLLGVLSLGTIYVLRFGRLPMSVVIRLAALFVRLHGRMGRLEHTVADQMFNQLLGDFSPERRDELSRLFEDMARDQSLMPQLMPESMDLFDAAVGTPRHIRCASVVTSAEPASLAGVVRVGLDPYAQATHALFYALYRLTGEMTHHFLPRLSEAQRSQLEAGFGHAPTPADNDGIVPALSQVWEEIIHVARADHFDVIGHFREPHHRPPHYDWLTSDGAFNRESFEELWGAVARFVMRSAKDGS
jgi:triacylglycerol lipase